MVGKVFKQVSTDQELRLALLYPCNSKIEHDRKNYVINPFTHTETFNI